MMNTELLQQFQAVPTPAQKAETVRFLHQLQTINIFFSPIAH